MFSIECVSHCRRARVNARHMLQPLYVCLICLPYMSASYVNARHMLETVGHFFLLLVFSFRFVVSGAERAVARQPACARHLLLRLFPAGTPSETVCALLYLLCKVTKC